MTQEIWLLPFHLPVLLTLFFLFAPSCTNAQTATSPSSSVVSSPAIAIPTFPTQLTLPALDVSNSIVQLTLPPTSTLFITLNICSLGTNASLLPTILISTTSPPTFNLGLRTTADSRSGGVRVPNRRNRGSTVWQLEWEMGFANWTWTGTGEVGVEMLVGLGMRSDGTAEASVVAGGNVNVQVGMSADGPLQSLSPAAPLLGDTTVTSALLFSPLLLSAPHPQPSYPNYTLPPPQLSLPSYPSTQLNLTSLSTSLTLLILPTASSPTRDGLDNSLCAVQAAYTSTGAVADRSRLLVNATTSWMAVGGEEGFRTMWVVGDLVAETNYTAWIVDERGGMSSPIWFSTKESTFPCQLVLPNPLCPSIAYAAPLGPNTINSINYPIYTLPDDITSLITSSFQSFSTSLLTTACGRDLYSHVSTCADCHAAYRDWVCRVVLPQCASSSSSSSSSATSAIPPQKVFRSISSPRNPNVIPSYGYDELLPCLSVCNAVDRACPAFLKFRCPIRGITANRSYAHVGEDADSGDGSEELGVPAMNRWGDRWCNG